MPPEVSARVLSALRAARPAHTDRPLRWRRTALWCGVAAALTGLGVGAIALSGGSSEPPGPAGPTAQQITVARRAVPMPLPDAAILALLARPADLGGLADPHRWSDCLARLGREAATPVLGARPVTMAGRPATLVVFPAEQPGQVSAVVLDAGCGAADTRPLAETTLPRP